MTKERIVLYVFAVVVIAGLLYALKETTALNASLDAINI